MFVLEPRSASTFAAGRVRPDGFELGLDVTERLLAVGAAYFKQFLDSKDNLSGMRGPAKNQTHFCKLNMRDFK